ncbi:MAG: hypothetical protein HYS86_03800, partial [Candidatus Chisholmbacteria bacterium]|nr:hypothetical protein [Candidatus Chisholmbacteria bacterium]
MKQLMLIGLFLALFGMVFYSRVGAQVGPRRTPTPTPAADPAAAGEATMSGFEATGSAAVRRVLEEKEDITETGGRVTGKLGQFLLDNPVGPLSWNNPLQKAIRLAVEKGVPANTIVLIFLFPLITALIAAFRHLVGLRGFGIFVPAILAVALVATGIIPGLALFVIILLVATIARMNTRRMKLQYLPRVALVMWLVSLGVFGALLLASVLGFQEATVLSIFPILILILLAENFIEVQLSKSRREAVQVTAESLLMALFASVVVSLEVVQKSVLLYPEFFVIFVAVFNVFVGRFVGLRLMELWKFRELLRS